jgi:hypothetical protein
VKTGIISGPIEETPCLEANRDYASEEIPILWNLKVYYQQEHVTVPYPDPDESGTHVLILIF